MKRWLLSDLCPYRRRPATWWSFAAFMFPIAAGYLLFDGVVMTISGALRGAGDTRWPMWISLLAVCVLFVPGVYLLGGIPELGVRGVPGRQGSPGGPLRDGSGAGSGGGGSGLVWPGGFSRGDSGDEPGGGTSGRGWPGGSVRGNVGVGPAGGPSRFALAGPAVIYEAFLSGSTGYHSTLSGRLLPFCRSMCR